MSLIELIGFVISMVAMIFLFAKRIREERHRRNHPEEYEHEQEQKEQNLKELLRSLDIDMHDEEQFSPPPRPQIHHPEPVHHPQVHSHNTDPKYVRNTPPSRLLQDNYKLKTQIENRKLETSIEKRQFKSSIEDRYTDPFGSRVVSVDLAQATDVDAYKVIKKERKNRGIEALRRQKSMKDIIILQEIMNPPKGLR